MNVSIYNATFSEIKGKNSVEFDLNEASEIEGVGFIAVKNGKSEHFNILITDEDNKDLTRSEIVEFLQKKGIDAKNSAIKFPIL